MGQEIYKGIYKLMVGIFSLIDFLEESVSLLSGNTAKEDLLISFLSNKAIANTFYIITLIGVILLFAFTILAILKSQTEKGREGRSLIAGNSLKSFLSFFLIPFFLFATIYLVNTIMSSVNRGITGFYSPSMNMGAELAVTVCKGAFLRDAGMLEGIESRIFSGEIDYKNANEMSPYYDLSSVNYIVGILGGLVILVMLFLVAILFVQRMFDIALLYIISPIPISTMPLDGGSRFSVWRELVIGKTLSAYGVILSLSLFFLVMPIISKSIIFESQELNGYMKLVFIIGGTFAITKANLLTSQLIGSHANRNEIADLLGNMRAGRAIAASIGGLASSFSGKAFGGSQFISTKRREGSLGAIIETLSLKGRVIESGEKGRKAVLDNTKGIIKNLISGGAIKTGKDIAATIKNKRK